MVELDLKHYKNRHSLAGKMARVICCISALKNPCHFAYSVVKMKHVTQLST